MRAGASVDPVSEPTNGDAPAPPSGAVEATPDPGEHVGGGEPASEGDATHPDEPGSEGEAAHEVDLDAIEGDLAGVEAALGRLAEGTYWTDEATGEAIPDDELAADPTARRRRAG